MEKNNKTSIKSILRRILPGLILGFVVMLALVFVGDLRQAGNWQVFFKRLAGFNWGIYPLVLLLTLVNYGLRFVKWHFYLRLVGVKTIPWKDSLRLFVGGFPLAVSPGKAAEVLKAVWIKQRSGLPVPQGISVVVAERITDGLAVLVLSTLGVVTYPQYWPAFAVVLAGLLTIVIISQIRPAALWLLNLGEKIPLLKRAIPALRHFYEGSFLLFRPLPTLMGVGLGSISWFMEGLGFFLILVALGFPADLKTLSSAVFTLAFSIVIGAASTLPGGLGASETSITGMIIALLGTDLATAKAAATLIRLATLWFSVLLGLATWLAFPTAFEVIGNEEKDAQS